MTVAPQWIDATGVAAPPVERGVAPSVRHRLSRWHAVPLATRLAGWLAGTRVRPWQVTCAGFLLTLVACALLAGAAEWRLAAAGVLWSAWLCDRLDGALARRQGTSTALGAWLDANLDELADVLVHAALAWQLAGATEQDWPWLAYAAFVAGKYLFFSGQQSEQAISAVDMAPAPREPRMSLARRLYHALGDADVRLHLLLAAVATGFVAYELITVAAYYNARWIVRYGLVARRLAGRPA